MTPRIAWMALVLGLGPVLRANTFEPGDRFGGDTRKAVTELGPPWSAIGKLSLPHRRFMTATLVGSDLLLTAAHGLVRDGRLIPGGFVFRAGFGPADGGGADGAARVTRVWLGSFRPRNFPGLGADWALLRIDRPLGKTCGMLEVEDAESTGLSQNPQPFYCASYAVDFQAGRAPSWEQGAEFLASGPVGFLLHDFSTDHGASGAPIFYFPARDHHGVARIVAITVGERTPHDETLHRVPFSPRVANIAVAAHAFYGAWRDLLAGGEPAGGLTPP